MMVRDLITHINSLADEQLPDNEVLSFVNDAMADIGREVDAVFPTLETVYDEPAIPEKWQRLLLIPFAKGRVKEKDASQFEWEAAYSQFFANLSDFLSSYTVPREYRELKPEMPIMVNGEQMTTESGDTLDSIARSNGTNVASLLAENKEISYLGNTFESGIYDNIPSFWGRVRW